jgi:hypothetical protein
MKVLHDQFNYTIGGGTAQFCQQAAISKRRNG